MNSPIEDQGRGAFVDWTTQRWVRATGRRVALDECSWLEGPVGDVDVIGADFFARFAEREGLTMVTDGPPRGLVEDFGPSPARLAILPGWMRGLWSLPNTAKRCLISRRFQMSQMFRSSVKVVLTESLETS
jgi:hypothetical protein